VDPIGRVRLSVGAADEESAVGVSLSDAVHRRNLGLGTLRRADQPHLYIETTTTIKLIQIAGEHTHTHTHAQTSTHRGIALIRAESRTRPHWTCRSAAPTTTIILICMQTNRQIDRQTDTHTQILQTHRGGISDSAPSEVPISRTCEYDLRL